jgi:1-acyl-sn-glycerol-3-phosphate acyltransferase
MVEINKSAFEWNDFKKILNSLKKGKLVLIFPEGKLNDKEKLANFKEGLVTIAHLANVPIYPIYILPKHKPFHKQHIMLGETIDLHKQFKELNTENCKEMVK